MGWGISRRGWRCGILLFGLSETGLGTRDCGLQVVGVQVEDFDHVVVVGFLEEN